MQGGQGILGRQGVTWQPLPLPRQQLGLAAHERHGVEPWQAQLAAHRKARHTTVQARLECVSLQHQHVAVQSVTWMSAGHTKFAVSLKEHLAATVIADPLLRHIHVFPTNPSPRRVTM